VNQQQSQFVIVGGSAAGMAAAHAIREKDPRGTITVLSAEPDAPYFRPLIPFLVAGKKTPAEMAMTGCGPYTGANIVVQTGARVASVDTSACCVVMEDGTRHGYKKILFATGSRPYVPPEIEGTDAEGVFALRTLVDAREMAARRERTTHAVMRGGGLPDTHTAGDVAVTYEPVTGAPIMTALWTNAVEMGRCAGLNMAGVKTVYTGTFGILNATQVADEPFVAMGVVHTTGKDCEIHQKATASTFRKLVFDVDSLRFHQTLAVK
jgi:NADPH-dependent 2,4-dienoyl-CoA reductase/sulfur reductase-like enzyme